MNDQYDKKFIAWSRIYEYQAVLDAINAKYTSEVKIHNTSCGNSKCHLEFMSSLDNSFDYILHSDISTKWAWDVRTNKRIKHHDITKRYIRFYDKFDVVLNISTLEHLDKNLILKSLDNLLSQVKVGGLLVVTFDYPDVDLNVIEQWAGESVSDVGIRLNGSNSAVPNHDHSDLNVVYLEIIRQ